MALPAAQDVVHGPLEALFTVDEEDAFTGIEAPAPSALKGRTYTNVDNEVEGEPSTAVPEASTSRPDGPTARSRRRPAARGARSGLTACLVATPGSTSTRRGSAHQLMARLLVGAPAELGGVRLAELIAGDMGKCDPSRGDRDRRLRIGNARFTAGAYPRSALDSERDAEAQRYVKVFERAGATVTVSGAFPSWPRYDSMLWMRDLKEGVAYLPN